MSTELIDRLITNLDHDIEVLTERRRLAAELRATWSDEASRLREAIAEPEPPAKPAARKKRVAKRKAEPNPDGYECDECGKVLPTEVGLKTHRGRVHKNQPARPALEVVPNEPKTIAPDPSLRYRCSTCDFTDATREELARHTVDVHHRGLRPEEHAARAEAVAS